MISESGFRIIIYLNGFVLGFVLMGFEMLSSRFLNPWFGSGIDTWAAIISITLLSLMIGYFIGGRLVDRFPHTRVLGVLVVLASATMLLIALPIGNFDAPFNQWTFLGKYLVEVISLNVESLKLGVNLAAVIVILFPVTLIACYSPFAVRLLLVSTASSGRQTGMVYGINTFGNILGTWATSFWLVPSLGSIAITLWFAAITFACGLVFLFLPQPVRAAP